MDLNLSSEERAVVDSVRSLASALAATRTPAALLEYAPIDRTGAWVSELARFGWTGMLVAEEYGGASAPLMSAALVYEELGRAAAPLSVYTSAVLASSILQALATEATRAEVLPAIVDGSAVVAMSGISASLPQPTAGLPVSVKGDSVRLEGDCGILVGVDEPTHVLIPFAAPNSGDISFALTDMSDPGITLRPLSGLIAAGAALTVAIDVPQERVTRSVAADDLPAVLQPALAVLAAFQLGGCSTLLEKSSWYANTRIQFGKRIGTFQRVQDHVIHILNGRDETRLMTYEALSRLDAGLPARVNVHLAKAVASESYYLSANHAHEIHAGIGCDPAAGITEHTILSRSTYQLLGKPRTHLRLMAGLLVGEADH